MKRWLILALACLATTTLFAVDVREVRFPDAVRLEHDYLLGVFGVVPGDPFSSAAIDQGLDRLYDEGWFRDRPTSETEVVAGEVIILVRFQEFPVVQSVVLEGITWLDPAEILLLLPVQSGKPLNLHDVSEAWRVIRAEYAAAGYPWILPARETMDPASDTVILGVHEPLLGEVRFTGLSRTKPDALRRFLWMKTGDPLSEQAVRLDARDLFSTGVFSAMPEVIVQPPDDEAKMPFMDLEYNVQETQTGRLLFGVGFGELSGLSGSVQYQESNFRGQLMNVSAGIAIGESGSTYDLSYGNPSFGPHHMSWSARVFRSRGLVRIFPDGGGMDSDYISRSTGGQIDLGRPLDRFHRLDLRLAASDQRFSLDDGPALTPPELEDARLVDGNVRTARLSHTRDTRLNPFDPEQGDWTRLSTEWGMSWFDGDFPYNKHTAEGRMYRRVSPSWIWAGRLKGGLLGGDAPATALFWMGGSRSVRGHKVGELKGDYSSLANLEFRWKKPDEVWGLVLFADAGSAGDGEEFLLFDDALTSVGVGVRFVVPFFGIAPIRLDVAYNLQSDDTEFHFDIGHLF